MCVVRFGDGWERLRSLRSGPITEWTKDRDEVVRDNSLPDVMNSRDEIRLGLKRNTGWRLFPTYSPVFSLYCLFSFCFLVIKSVIEIFIV